MPLTLSRHSLLAGVACIALASGAGTKALGDEPTPMLTVFFRHDQSKPQDELETDLSRNGVWERFPPEGGEVVSWHGIGQGVTSKLPAGKLRDLNLTLEETAWGP